MSTKSSAPWLWDTFRANISTISIKEPPCLFTLTSKSDQKLFHGPRIKTCHTLNWGSDGFGALRLQMCLLAPALYCSEQWLWLEPVLELKLKTQSSLWQHKECNPLRDGQWAAEMCCTHCEPLEWETPNLPQHQGKKLMVDWYHNNTQNNNDNNPEVDTTTEPTWETHQRSSQVIFSHLVFFYLVVHIVVSMYRLREPRGDATHYVHKR